MLFPSPIYFLICQTHILKKMGSISDNNNYNVKQQLSPTVRRRVEFLRHLQSQYDELEADFLEERKVLEAKYQKLYEPMYKKRYEIVNGIKEVEGVTNEVIIEGDNATIEKGVPEFWLTAMKTHDFLGEEIKGRDEGALKFLEDIKCSRLHDPQGFKLEFYFNPNPYFKNSVLTKTYHLVDESDPVLDQAFGTEIVWYPGKCLTKKLVKKKPRVGSKNTKPITTLENYESFFTFFNPPEFPKDEDDLDDDAYEEFLNRMEQDYNMGKIIRDKIIPHAVSWFTGEAIEDGDDGFNADDNSDDDEDDDDEDEDEIEDEDKIEDTSKDKDNDEDEEEEKGKINWKKVVYEDDDGAEEQEEETRVLKKGMDMDKDTKDDEEEEGEWTTKKDMDDDGDTNDDEEEEEKGNQGWKKTSNGPKKTGGQVQQKENPRGCKQQVCWAAQV